MNLQGEADYLFPTRVLIAVCAVIRPSSAAKVFYLPTVWLASCRIRLNCFFIFLQFARESRQKKHQLTFLTQRTPVREYSTARAIMNESSLVCNHHLQRMKTPEIIICAFCSSLETRDAPLSAGDAATGHCG